MRLADHPRTVGDHRNAFGFWRLLFASLVIASHVPELVDNDPHRELLYRLTGVLTFGNLAVAGFFVISGYLITGSLSSSRSLSSYAIKRISRIYPGFVVASLVCLVIVAPLAGAGLDHGLTATAVASFAQMAVLGRPTIEHPFAGQAFSSDDGGLDGAMWTVQYEALCYVLLALLFALGLVRKEMVAALAALLLIIGTGLPDGALSWLSQSAVFPAKPSSLFALSGMFLSGSAWYLYRERVRIDASFLLVAAIGLAISVSNRYLAQVGLAVFGSYIILAVAFGGSGTWLERVNNRTDVSYGVYIYAWPIEQLLIRWTGPAHLLLLGAETWVLAIGCGWLSWTLVEKPALAVARRWLRGTAAAAEPSRLIAGSA